MGSASEQKLSAHAQATERTLKALQNSRSTVAAPEPMPAPVSLAHSSGVAASNTTSPLSPQMSLQLHSGLTHGQQAQDVPSWAAQAAQTPATEIAPEPDVPVHFSKGTGSSRSSSLSPQPSMQLHTGMSHGQHAEEVPWPSWAAPAAQAPATPPQEGEPWQEVRKSRRKPVSQQGASKASLRKSLTQGRVSFDQQTPDSSPSPLKEMPAAASHLAQPPLTPGKSGVATPAQRVHAAAEQSPHRAFASAESTPQQQSHHTNSASLQPPRSQAFPFSMQHEPLQRTAGSSPADEPCPAPATSPCEQVRVMLACIYTCQSGQSTWAQ